MKVRKPIQMWWSFRIVPKYIYYNKVVLTQRVVKISSDILRKIRGKNWEKQAVWCHEQDTMKRFDMTIWTSVF